MGLGGALSTALSGLNVNERSLSVLSNNIANVNTQGYSRKTVEQSTAVLDGVGVGVNIDDIQRTVDIYLQRAVQEQGGVVGRAQTLTDYSGRLQLLLGSPGDATGINSYITSFTNAASALSQTPERSSNRVTFVNAGENLADEVNRLYSEIQDLRFEADQDISRAVNGINTDLNELFTLNEAIASANVLGRPTSDLFDQRDLAIERIASELDITTSFDDTGVVSVFARGGATLLSSILYEVEYVPTSSVLSFEIDSPQFSPIRTYALDENGDRISESVSVIEGGTAEEITNQLTRGNVSGLLDLRDEILPDVIAQLDELAAAVRDQVNAIHNAGSGIPGDNSLTGTRSVSGGSFSNWTGSARIGLVTVDGDAVASPYASDVGGYPPLTIDFSTLDDGSINGAGFPSTQAIINEINNYYGVPQNRVSVGNITNLELASTTPSLPASSFSFDLDATNYSGSATDLFVTGVTVLDDTGADITSVTNTAPSISLNATTTYTTQSGNSAVTIAADNHGLANGDYVFLPVPSTGVGGISNSQLGGFFQVSNVTTNGFDITAGVAASSTATLNEAGTGITKYFDSETGTVARTGTNGEFTAALTGNLTSTYYDIQVAVRTVDEDGSLSSSTVTYRVTNDTGNLYNQRYGASSATIDGIVEVPNQTSALATARLVDANGNELQQVNNAYLSDESGFLQIQTANGDTYISIDSLDSFENGNPNAVPFVEAGSGRGFSHFFELNNFFTSNVPTSTGDTVANSARNLTVESRISTDPSRIATGTLSLSLQPADPDATPLYTYERLPGDASVVEGLADLVDTIVSFSAAGGLSATNQTLAGYAGELLAAAGADANNFESNFTNATTILQGFTERKDNISGVNLDQELASTLTFQQAYTASARVISVISALFDALLQDLR